MEPQCEIKFTTTRSDTDLNAGKTCYQGQLRHNAVLTLKETRKAFAEYCGEPESKTGRYIDSLGEFIAREVAAGHHLNFGPFGVSLKMLGGFKAANSPFDEKKNAISVCLIPGKEIKAAVKALKPVNVTEETRWNISSTLQRFPYEVYDQIVAEGTRKISVCGYVPEVHVGKPDEGVWLENDAGEKVLVATISKAEFAHTDCTLEGPLERGDYWIVVQSRYKDEPNLIRCRRRIKVV